MPPLMRPRWVHILPQARQGVFQLGQLDLQAGLGGAGARGEDVEDQLAAVEDFDLGRFFQVANLRRRQIVVEDDHVGVRGLDLRLEFCDFALADVAGRIDFQTPLAEAADDDGAGGGRQAAQFFERVIANPGAVRHVHADEKGFFEMDGQFVAMVIESHGLFYFLLGGVRYLKSATPLLQL